MNDKDKKEFLKRMEDEWEGSTYYVVWGEVYDGEIVSKKAEWQREVLSEVLEAIENPQHKYYSSPKRYIKSLIERK